MLRLNVLLSLLVASIVLLAAVAEGGQADGAVRTPVLHEFLTTLSAQQRAWLRDHPVIRVAQDPDWPPVEFTNERGEPSGMANDYLRLVEQRLGVQFARVRNLSWQEAYARLKRGEIDMTTSVAVTPEREEFWAFTQPYMRIPIVIVAHADVTYIADMRELAGKKVAVVDGYAVNDWLPRDFPAIRLVRVTTAQAGLAALQRGEVFAYIENMLVVGYQLSKLKMTNLKIAGETPYINAQCMAVRKDWATLAGILQQALDSISEAERNDIYRKWLPVRYEHGFNYTLLWQALAVFAVVLLALVVWNRKLAREIMHRKKADAARRDAETRYRLLFEQSPDGIVIIDPATARLLEFNETAHRQLGYSREEFARLSIADFEAVETPEETMSRIAKVTREGRNEFETRHRTRQGEIRNVHVTAQFTEMLGRPVYHCIWRDITERTRAEAQMSQLFAQAEAARRTLLSVVEDQKRAEDALRESAQRIRLLLDSINEGLYGVDTQGNCAFVNRACLQMLGYDKEEALLGRHIHELIHHTRPDGTPCSAEECRMYEALRRSAETHVDDEVFWRRDGSSFPVEYWSHPMYCDGRVVGAVATFFDITERRRTAESHVRLATAVEQAAEAIMITDTNATIFYVNPAFEKITGYTREEAIGQNPRILSSGRQDAAFYRDLWETLLGGNVWQGRFVNRKKNGALYTEEATISPVRDAAGAIINYVAVKRDITEDLNLQAQLTQAQKMESVGRLAGGVAHDFNNILQVILGNAQLAVEQAGHGDPVRIDLEEIQGAAQRAADLTRQLLAFASKQVITPQTLDFNETVEGMLKMLRRLIGENIELVWTPRAGLWPIRMDPSQIDQILANLCVNARDAIDGVGTVHIATENVHVDELQLARHEEFLPGDYVVLLVSDTGGGMDKETQARIFEPFFTTKAVGKGTGLGLATVFGIVRQNHGHIGVYSEPGQGTTFRIHLPRYLGADAAQLVEGPATPAARGCETVLLVEDDAAILNMSGRMLRGLGYTVLAAATPEAALRMAEEHAGEIHLLMTDVVMPGMNGRELAEQLKARRPNLKSLFMSGFTADVISIHGVLDEGVQFIQKPFSMEDLAAKLREALDSA